MGFIKNNYGEEAENQVVMHALVVSGILGNMLLFHIFREFVMSIKENLNKFKQNIR